MTLKSHNMTSENPDENQVARAPSDQPEESARREFIAKAVSVFAGGAIVSVPIGVGVATLLGPAFKEGQGGIKIRLAALEDLSDDSRLNHRFPYTAGVLAEECSTLLRDFFREIRAQKKAERRARRLADSSNEP